MLANIPEHTTLLCAKVAPRCPSFIMPFITSFYYLRVFQKIIRKLSGFSANTWYIFTTALIIFAFWWSEIFPKLKIVLIFRLPGSFRLFIHRQNSTTIIRKYFFLTHSKTPLSNCDGIFESIFSFACFFQVIDIKILPASLSLFVALSKIV